MQMVLSVSFQKAFFNVIGKVWQYFFSLEYRFCVGIPGQLNAGNQPTR